MREEVRFRLEKAERAIQAARLELDGGLPDFALSDAYYALFYVAEALLLDRGLRFRSHGAVHAAFGREFAKTGILDRKHHRRLIDAFQKRLEVDYDVGTDTPPDVVDEVIGWAEEFLREARSYLTTTHEKPKRP